MKIKDMIEMPEVSSVFGELLDELGEKEVKLTLDEGKIEKVLLSSTMIHLPIIKVVSQALKQRAGEIIVKE